MREGTGEGIILTSIIQLLVTVQCPSSALVGAHLISKMQLPTRSQTTCPPTASAMSSDQTSPKLSQGRCFGLTLRYRRHCSTTEITQVGLTPSLASSPSDLCAFAVYDDAQTTQPWVDVFGISSQRGYAKAAGSYAVLAPLAGVSSGRLASFCRGTVPLGRAAEHRRGSSVVVRDLVTGRTTLEIKHATAGPLAWSRQGTALAAGEARNRVGVWDARSGLRTGRVVGHIDEVINAAFTPDSELVTTSRDGTVRITDPRTSRTLSKLEVDAGSTNPRALAVSPDGGSIVSLWGTTLHIWLPRTGQLTSWGLHAARGSEGWPLCISPDCRWMACRTEKGFDVVEVATGCIVWEGGCESAAMFTAGAFSFDSRVLVLGTVDGFVEIWDVGREE